MSYDPLTSEERALWSLCQAEGPDALIDWVPIVTPWLHAPEHLLPLAELFYRAESVGSVRALTSTPPQHAKTTSILHWLARFVKRYPSKTCAYVTYEAGLAYSKSKECRAIAERAGVELRDDSTAAREWRTRQGGGLIATGIGGPLTGQTVDLLVIDDPVKNRQVAESPAFQKAAIEWAKSTAFTRIPPSGSIIVNMARWSDGDLVGRLPYETDIPWEVINIPAILSDGTPEARALWPKGKPLEFLRSQKRLVGPYEWAALYEGSPQPRGGAMFRHPSTYDEFLVPGARYAIGCDPAASARTSADHSAIVVMAAVGEGISQQAYVLEVWKGQVEVPTLVEQLRLIQARWACPVFVESAGGFKAVAQILRAIGGRDARQDANPRDPLRVVEVTPLGDKFTRALPVSAAWNDGRVLVPKDKPWVRPFIDEVSRFTGKGDKQDDQVDALAHAYNAVDRRASALRRGVHSLPV